jgi:hypothetical protein
MFLLSLLLPLYDNDRVSFPREMFRAVANELTDKFGGLTAHTRAPAQGLWQNQAEAPPTRDDIVIFEVMVEVIDRAWWSHYRRELERRFRQDHVIVRAHDVELL